MRPSSGSAPELAGRFVCHGDGGRFRRRPACGELRAQHQLHYGVDGVAPGARIQGMYPPSDRQRQVPPRGAVAVVPAKAQRGSAPSVFAAIQPAARTHRVRVETRAALGLAQPALLSPDMPSSKSSVPASGCGRKQTPCRAGCAALLETPRLLPQFEP